jgi:hypothetical protein
MGRRSKICAKATAAAVALLGAFAGAPPGALLAAEAVNDRPIGEPLSVAGQKYGLSDADMAAIRAAGGEFSCPGDGKDGARLNGWLIGDREVLTNAHAIIESEDDPGHPYLRQPVFECFFTSSLDLGKDDRAQYLLNLNGLGAVLRRGAKAPIDPSGRFGGDVVRLHLQKPVPGGRPLAFDPSPVAKGDTLILVSRVPTAYRGQALPGDDLMVSLCTVTRLDALSGTFSRGVTTDCNGAEGMSAGMLFTHVGGKLVAKGFLVEIDYLPGQNGKADEVIGTHILTFDQRFANWLKGGCAFWPSALLISFCGEKRG